MEKQVQGVWSSLKELTTVNTINQGSSMNRLKIVCIGKQIELYVNNNPIESTYPFWPIDHVVRRTNIFINPDLATVQRDYYNPSFFPLIMMILKKNLVGYKSIFPSSISWLHYKTLSEEIKKIWGNIELNNSMDMIREIYSGKTDFRFFIVQKMGMYVPLHQWVACPETGDILVSFADAENEAHENPIFFFNLFELLDSKPSYDLKNR